jgi:hypothetical protein
MNTETLQKLLHDGLAIMEPNDPAKPQLRARLYVGSDYLGPIVSLSFYDYSPTPPRECHGSGSTAEEALAEFRANYRALLTKEGQIAALKAQIAALEGGQS